jgi:hypothetical protein
MNRIACIISLLMFLIFISSCSKDDSVSEVDIVPEPNFSYQIYPWGHLLILNQTVVLPNGWYAYVDSGLLTDGEIDQYIDFGELKYKGWIVNHPAGEVIVCPEKGKNCGDVNDIDDDTGEIEYIGKYLK